MWSWLSGPGGAGSVGGDETVDTSPGPNQSRDGDAPRLLPLDIRVERYIRRCVRARDTATKNKHSSSCACDRAASSATVRSPAPETSPAGGGHCDVRCVVGKLATVR